MISAAALAILMTMPSGSATPFDVDAPAETVGTVSALTVIGLLELWVKPTLVGGLGCDPVVGDYRCPKKELNGLDRTVVGNHSAAWKETGDWMVVGTGAAMLAATIAGAALADTDTPAADALTDVLVWSEAVTAALFTVQVFKFAARRPRPTQYDADLANDEPDYSLSFPSGHTAFVAAATTAAATTFAYRNPDSPWRWAAMVAAGALVGLTGYARIGGGKHFYTDVIAGAVIGGSLGWLMPHLHRGQQIGVSGGVAANGSPLRGLTLRLAF